MGGEAASFAHSGISVNLRTGVLALTALAMNGFTYTLAADIGDRLVIQGMFHNNEGVLVVEGGRMDVSGNLFNSGQINLINGSFTANDFVSNFGSMSVTNLTARFESQLSGDGTIQVSGSHAEFFVTVNIQPAGLASWLRILATASAVRRGRAGG